MIKHIPTVLSIQDFCCLGRCALTVTIPVLSSLGVQPVALPTSLFSNTPLFPHMEHADVTDEAMRFMDAWSANEASFDAIQSGFLYSPSHVAIVLEAMRRFAKEGQITIVDPAMADHGKLYAIFDSTMVKAMKELVSHAQIITPNYTEALLLTDKEYSPEPLEWEAIKALCRALHEVGPRKIIITSIPSPNDMIRTALFDADEESFTVIDTPKVPISAPGTGDIFTAMLTGSLLQGLPLEEATRKAVLFTYKAIKYTYEHKGDPTYGVILEHILPNQN